MLPNTSLTIRIYTKQIEVGNVDALTTIQPKVPISGSANRDNFKALEYAEGIPNFFEQYKDFV